MWYILALASALFASLRRANEKQLTHKLNHFTIGWTVQLSAVPLLLVATAIFGAFYNPLTLSAAFWVPLLLHAICITPLNQYLYMSALKHGELSRLIPLQSLIPAFSLLLGWMILGERPSLVAALCIVVIVFGIYVLNVQASWRPSLRRLRHGHISNRYGLVSILLLVLGTTLDAKGIRASEPVFYSLVSTVCAAITMFASAKLFGVRERRAIHTNFRDLAIAGSLAGVTFMTFSAAVAVGPLSYTMAVRGCAAILIGSFIGFKKLQETVTRNKLTGLAIVLLASVFLALS